MKSTKISLAASLAVFAWTMVATPQVHAQNLTGIALHNTAGNGWNSLGGDLANNLYISTTNSLDGLLNTGNGSAASINLSLQPGENTFFFWGNTTGWAPLAMELFIDGTNTSDPSISATNSLGAVGTNLAAWNGTAFKLDYSFGAPANSLTYGSITLTSFFYGESSPTQDLVGSYSTGADGLNDTYGSFTLTVTSAPEPGALSLCLIAVPLLVRWRRRASEKEKAE